ncbi:unnamed protein product [Sympodiomycopsis kandeliae]
MSNSLSRSGERLTLTYAHRGNLALKVDVYPFTQKEPTTSSASSFPPQYPFVLFLHSCPTNPFFAGSRRNIPSWLLNICHVNNWPLLSADYRLAPEASQSDTWKDVVDLWKFINDQNNGFNWSIESAGPGSEADSGSCSLGEGFQRLQSARGIDPRKASIFAMGGAAPLGIAAAALLDPSPISITLTCPIIDPNAPFYNTPRPHHPPPSTPAQEVRLRSNRIRQVLSRTGQSDQAITTAIESSHRGASTSHPTSLIKSWSENWPWWRFSRTSAPRRDSPEMKAGKERNGLYEVVMKSGRLAGVLQPDEAIRTEYLLDPKLNHMIKTPFPPILILSGGHDQFTDPQGPRRLSVLLQKLDPAAAALDRLLQAGLRREQRMHALNTARIQRQQQGTRSQSSPKDSIASQHTLFDPSQRFIHRIVSQAPHAFDAYAQREDKRYIGEFDAVQSFIGTWISYAALTSTPAQHKAPRRRHEKL